MSSPASSQGALSSRSRGDSLTQDVFPPVHHGSGAQGPYSARGHRVYNDLSREIDAVRRTIFQESRLLRSQLAEVSVEAGRLAAAAATAAAAPAPDAAAEPAVEAAEPLPAALRGYCPSAASSCPAPRPCRTVEWRIRGVDGQHGAEGGTCAACSFDLPEYPEVVFALRFGAGRCTGEALSGGEPPRPGRWPCQLRLRVSGPGCVNLDLRVGLSAELCEDGARREDEPSGALLGRAEAEPLRGGRASCMCAWPEAAKADVLCRVKVELAGVQSSRLHCARSARPSPVLGEADGVLCQYGGASPSGGGLSEAGQRGSH